MPIWLFRVDVRDPSLAIDALRQEQGAPRLVPIRSIAPTGLNFGDAVAIWYTSGPSNSDELSGVIGFGVIARDPNIPPDSDSRGRIPYAEIRVPLYENPISEIDLLGSRLLSEAYEKASDSSYLAPLNDRQWTALLDRCSIETLIRIERDVSPGALAAAGQSITTYSPYNVEDRDSRLGHNSNQSLRFRHLRVEDWRQFNSVEIAFGDRLTIITGANGAGKTSLLNLLSPHFNWSNPFISTPRRLPGRGLVYESGISSSEDQENTPRAVAHLEYSDSQTAIVHIAPESSSSYSIGWSNQQPVAGLYITSHRAIAGYSPVAQMPTEFSAGSALLEQFLNEVRTRYAGGYTGKSAGQWMKESLLAAAFHGAGSATADVDIERNFEAYEVWQGFQIVLRLLLPPRLGFQKLTVRSPEVVIVTRSGEFPLDAASGGISSLIELGWQVFLRSRDLPAFTVIFDEPENHLHPEMQREIVPRLLDAFPSVTFVVATHSPFIVTSVPDAQVFALDYEADGVSTSAIDLRRESKSAGEVLRKILGVESTMPLWADAAIDRTLARFAGQQVTPALLRELRQELAASGLLSEFPATAAILADDE